MASSVMACASSPSQPPPANQPTSSRPPVASLNAPSAKPAPCLRNDENTVGSVEGILAESEDGSGNLVLRLDHEVCVDREGTGQSTKVNEAVVVAEGGRKLLGKHVRVTGALGELLGHQFAAPLLVTADKVEPLP